MKPLAVSVPEFGGLVGVKLTKAWSLLRDGEVESFHIGRRTVVSMSSIEAFVERRQQCEKK
ncbi:DNA-binding protein [Sphingomonas montana]|uniref:DNA-binding protein n=1 Tax=Sphingomonas montana TaxID=1843236 RepID=UPI00101AD359|nr:DNA-binding protein [Sphingomonas montana]